MFLSSFFMMEENTREILEEFSFYLLFIIHLISFILQNIHQGYPHESLIRFLKAREGDVSKAYKMVRLNLFSKQVTFVTSLLSVYWTLWHLILQLCDCLKWRVENNIDGILAVSITMLTVYVIIWSLLTSMSYHRSVHMECDSLWDILAFDFDLFIQSFARYFWVQFGDLLSVFSYIVFGIHFINFKYVES